MLHIKINWQPKENIPSSESQKNNNHQYKTVQSSWAAPLQPSEEQTSQQETRTLIQKHQHQSINRIWTCDIRSTHDTNFTVKQLKPELLKYLTSVWLEDTEEWSLHLY